MSYPGGPPHGYGGYWNDHNPPNSYPYGIQGMHPHPTQYGARPQYEPPPQTQMAQYQNPMVQYTHTQGNMQMGQPMNHFEAPAPPPAQPTFEQSAFINPAQLFSQQPGHPPQSHRAEMPAPHSRSVSTSVLASGSQVQPIQTPNVPLDRPLLLMSLAEEFFDAAHSIAPSVTLSRTGENVEVYEKLISTGLACLDTALSHVRLAPRVEANIRLRYAGVLYEETENFMEAEIALSKGIALCDRVCF